MSDDIQVGDKYEWIKGENIGKEDIVKDPKMTEGSMVFVEFVSGRRISLNLVKEFLSIIGTVEELGIEANNDSHSTLTPSIYEAENIAVNNLVESNENSGLYLRLLEKIKTHEDVEFKLNISLPLPKKAALEVLIDAYGDDLKSELCKYIGKQLDDEIRAQVSEQILAWADTLSKNISENNFVKITTDEDNKITEESLSQMAKKE